MQCIFMCITKCLNNLFMCVKNAGITFLCVLKNVGIFFVLKKQVYFFVLKNACIPIYVC